MRSGILKQITRGYITLWGVPQQIHPVTESCETAEIAIMRFALKGDRGGYIYATNGLSQRNINPAQQSQLCVVVASPGDWVLSMMQALCLYPAQYDTAFTAYDTLQLGDNLKSLGYVALMFVPLSETSYGPYPFSKSPDTPVILLVQCIGISESELGFALQHGGRKLWETLSKNDKSILLDEPRLTPEA